jgi:SagB-type dehydrogenase family enzyme
MKKLPPIYLLSDKFKGSVTIQGRTKYSTKRNGGLVIVHGNLQFTYNASFAKYSVLVKCLRRSSLTIKELDTLINKNFQQTERDNAWFFVRTLIINNIITPYDNYISLTYHKSSSFGHFNQPSNDDIHLLQINHEKNDFNSKSEIYEDIEKVCNINKEAEYLQKLLNKRISTRVFNNTAIKREELNYILWASSGKITDSPYSKSSMHRTIPSAGALHSIKVYIACLNVMDVQAGVYEYDQSANELLPQNIKLPEKIETLFVTKHISYNQASCIIFLASFPQFMLGKYGDRGYRYSLLEAGHAAQNISLASIACDIGSVVVGGFDDDSVNSWLGLNLKAEHSLYSIVLGR